MYRHTYYACRSPRLVCVGPHNASWARLADIPPEWLDTRGRAEGVVKEQCLRSLYCSQVPHTNGIQVNEHEVHRYLLHSPTNSMERTN